MSLTQSLRDAYNSAEYHVSSYQPFVLKANEFSAYLQSLHLQHNCESSAFLTAHNPFSQKLTDSQNDISQQLLEAELTNFGLRLIKGFGQGGETNSDWRESSVLVLGISFDLSKMIAKKYEQNAFIWNGADCIPKLIFSESY
jgi:hypothetical protein